MNPKEEEVKEERLPTVTVTLLDASVTMWMSKA